MADAKEVSAGRGVAYIAAAKMYFMLAGAAIEFALPAILTRTAFGAYGWVAQAVSTVNNVMVTGTIQAVSRYTTADPSAAAGVRAAGVRMHRLVGLPIALAFAAASPLLAHLVHDPGKTGPLALAAAIIALYAFYAVFVGSANGTRAFHKQAGLDMTFATLRAVLLLGGAFAAGMVGLGVWGAIGGWVAAAAAILFVAVTWVGLPKDGPGADTLKPMLKYLGGVATYLIILNLILSVDQLLLKRLAADWMRLHPEWVREHSECLRKATCDLAGAVAEQADGQVGYYRAVQNLARLPYQLLIAVTFVIFPLVSRSTFEADHAKTQGYIRTTIRYSFLFAALMGAVLAANATPLLDVPYAAEYAREGGPALSLLALGNVAFAVFTIAGTILNGAGRTFDAIVVAGATLAALVVGLFVVVPGTHPGQAMLMASGGTTAAAMLAGAAASGIYLWRRFGAFVSPLSLLRGGLAIAAAFGVARVMPAGGNLMALIAAAASGLAFLAVLILSGELPLSQLARLARRGGKS
jgi:stage V sporulation protein B